MSNLVGVTYDRKNGHPPKPNLKEFDLEVGDRVRYKPKNKWKDDIRLGEFDDPTYNVWTITNLYKYVFTCQNRYGIRTSFRKDDYRIGEVLLHDKKPVASQMETTEKNTAR